MDDLIEAMKVVLGSTFILYAKVHFFHVNVEGMFFQPLHDLFGEQYAELWKEIDEIAERIRMLDAYAPSSLARMLELSVIKEQPGAPQASEMVLELFADHEAMLELLINAFDIANQSGAQGIADYLAGRIEAHSKHRWKLRASAKRLGTAAG